MQPIIGKMILRPEITGQPSNSRIGPQKSYSRPLKQRYPWDTDMTICIAAICDRRDDPKIVLCSDKRLDYGQVGSAEIGKKMGYVSRHCLALLAANNVTHAYELVAEYAHRFQSFDRMLTLEELCAPPRILKKRYMEQAVQMRLGMALDELKESGQRILPPEVYSRMWNELESIKLECELILAAFSSGKPYLFSFADGGVHPDHPFAVIGSGSWVANAALCQRGCNEQMPLSEVLYYVYEAKKMSEIVNGVGKKTQITVIAGGTKEDVLERFWELGVDDYKMLRDWYRQFGLKKFESVAKLAMRPALPAATRDR